MITYLSTGCVWTIFSLLLWYFFDDIPAENNIPIGFGIIFNVLFWPLFVFVAILAAVVSWYIKKQKK